MPPVSQGSRTGLITAVVLFSILFVTATIFAIYYGVDAAKSREEYDALRRQVVPEVLGEGGLNSPQLERLRQVRSSNPPGITNNRQALLDVAVIQRDRLSRLVDPSTESAADAEKNAEQALTAAATTSNVTLPSTTENLTGAVTALARAVNDRQERITAQDAEIAALTARVEETIKNNEAELAKKDEIVAGIRTQAQEQISRSKTDLDSSRQVITELERGRQQERSTIGQATDALNVQLAQAQKEAFDLRTELDKLRNQLEQGRVRVDEPMFREPDGRLLTVASNDIVYVNLGQGDQIIPGMTFEVYDKLLGMPRVDTSITSNENDTLPQGKASIEITRVGSASSEARITRRSHNAVLGEGDLISNLVYDRNTKYNFAVYGQFDLDRNGVSTDQDAEVVRRLITQWGGALATDVRVSTDFLVIGTEPALPEYTREELLLPENNARMIQAQARLDAYLAVVDQARELRVPILNQNRFLHFVGYYEQARR